MLGDDYISQHCLNVILEEKEKKLFRTYIAESLYAMSHNKALQVRYIDLTDESQKEERTEEEVKTNILEKYNKLRGKGVS